MDMLSYLTVLIKTRKEVGIPGLGTIYKKKSPGRYDAATHSFLPPSFLLDFNPEVLEQTLLIDHICKHRNISPDSAGYFVDQFVGEIKKQLDEHQEASLAPLGTLYQSSGILSFKPLNDQNFGFDFYGLPPVKDELSAASVSEVVSDPVKTSETEPLQEELPKTEDHQVTEEQLELENSNADLRDESLSPPVIEEVAKEEALSDEEVLLNEGAEDIAYEQIIAPVELSAKPEIQVTPELPVTPENEVLSEQDEQPVFEEIAEVETPKQPIAQPEIESIGNIEEQPEAIFEEPVATRPSINDLYSKASKTVDVPIPPIITSPISVSNETSAAEKEILRNGGFYNSNDEPAERTGIPVYLKILIAVLLILIGLVAGYFIRPDLFDSILKMGKDPIVVPVTAQNSAQKVDSLASADSLNNTLALNDTLKKDTLATAKPTGATVVNDPKAALANAPVQETGITYEVIGASVANEKEAERFIAQMKKLGLNAKAISPVPGKKKIKISIATFNDYNSADAEKPVLEKKLGIKDLYIHTNKPL